MRGSLRLYGWEPTAAENNRLAKLTNEQVREIRQSSESVQTLAKRYGVSDCTIRNVINRKRYASVE